MKQKIIKEAREILMLVGIFVVLYYLGIHIYLQQAILATGLMRPDTQVPEEKQRDANYDFELIDLEGNILHFSKFKNKVVFLNIWATWCPPCRAEMPDIHRLYQQIENQNVVFVMLSVDEEREKVVPYLQKNDFRFPVYFLKSALPNEFQHNSIPRTYVISPKGKVASQKIGMANYNNPVFQDFLKNLAKAN